MKNKKLQELIIARDSRKLQSLLAPETKSRKINWKQAIAGAIIGSIFSLSIASVLRKHENEARDRSTAIKMIDHMETEMAWNFNAMQLKAGGAWGLATHLPADKTTLRYQLSMITSTPFSKVVPQVWSHDYQVLSSLGPDGEKAFRSIPAMYAQLEEIEKSEAETVRLIEVEEDPQSRATIMSTLHDRYDELRSSFQSTGVTIERLRAQLNHNSNQKLARSAVRH